jgi:predicted regulator of Ras-like GTPase activity (Roadblock/LC7/MglB family)
MSPEPRTLRLVFHKRLAQLRSEIPAVLLAAIATEDGLLSATDESAEPSPLDRRAAVVSSLTAVARSAARELKLKEPRCVVIDCRQGVLLVRPFGKPRKRLLLVQLNDPGEAGRALTAVHALAHELQERLAPASRQADDAANEPHSPADDERDAEPGSPQDGTSDEARTTDAPPPLPAPAAEIRAA